MQSAMNISRRSHTFFSAGPLVQGLVLAIFSAWLIQRASLGETYNFAAIYSGIFSILSIFVGFLSTFYIFIAAKSNKFLESIRKTATFVTMLGLLRFTIAWALAMVVVTFILTIIAPKDFEPYSFIQVVILFWCWSMFLIIVNFARCVRMFISIIEGPT